MIEILEQLVSTNFLVVNEGDDYKKFRQTIVGKRLDDYVVVLEKRSGRPIKVATIEQINQIEKSSINSLEVFSKKFTEAYCVDIDVPPELLLIYIAKIKSVLEFPGLILLKDNLVESILPGKALYKLLSDFERKLGIKGTRSPDPFGVISLLQLPDLVCYRCPVCNYLTKTTIRENVPTCHTPWHGLMVLTSCNNSERK